MATTYWDFDTDKPAGDMTLKADWKIKKVGLNVFDDTNFLKDRYNPVGDNYHNDMVTYNIGGHGLDYRHLNYYVSQNNKQITRAQDEWGEANIIGSTFSFGDDYGMEIGDKVSLGTDDNTSAYLITTPGRSDGLTPWMFLRGSGFSNSSGWLMLRCGNSGWVETWGTLDSTIMTRMIWQAAITRYMPAGTYVPDNCCPDNTLKAWMFHFNRCRSIYVDYGTTVGQLLSRSDLPTSWKKAEGSVKPPTEWVVNTSGSAWYGKKLSEVPANTQITGYWDIRVRY